MDDTTNTTTWEDELMALQQLMSDTRHPSALTDDELTVANRREVAYRSIGHWLDTVAEYVKVGSLEMTALAQTLRNAQFEIAAIRYFGVGSDQARDMVKLSPPELVPPLLVWSGA